MPEYMFKGRRVRPMTPEGIAAHERHIHETFPSGPRVGDLALARRDWWTTYLRQDLGLLPKGVDIPPPTVGDKEYTLRTTGKFPKRKRQSLIVQMPNTAFEDAAKKSEPSSPSLAYDRFMTAVGQGNHWTVTTAAERQRIAWEPVQTWRWRWIETPDRCPRTNIPWNELTARFSAETPPSLLVSLEEYVLAWCAVRHEHQRMLDTPTYCWLRTRFGQGAFNVFWSDDQFDVFGYSAEQLPLSVGSFGGRASDPVG